MFVSVYVLDLNKRNTFLYSCPAVNVSCLLLSLLFDRYFILIVFFKKITLSHLS